jgi:amidase
VKDLIDVAGVPTTAGTRARADAPPATEDAPCLTGARAAGARIVGKLNLHELAFGGTGVNPWFGTPVNPLDPTLVPGGSSSGSAVAVASGEADVAYGSDTGGSVRIPSACCGTVGLKTTHGRVSLEGVWPLAPSLDTIGPMATDVAGVALGMQLLEPGFQVAEDAPAVVGRIRIPGTDPAIDDAIDRALVEARLAVVELNLPRWKEATYAALVLLVAEAFAVDGQLLADHPDDVGADVAERIRHGATITDERRTWTEGIRDLWRTELDEAFGQVGALALPTLINETPSLDGAVEGNLTAATAALNLSGNPALALPVPREGTLPTSLQLVGPRNGEEGLLALGAVIESALG